MAVQTGRDYLTEHLTPLLPGKWSVLPYDTNLDVIIDPVLMFRIQSLAKLSQAPASTYLGTWILTVIAPPQDPAKADPQLDDLVMAVLDALTAARIKWTTADKAMWGKVNLCYDITIELPTARS